MSNSAVFDLIKSEASSVGIDLKNDLKKDFFIDTIRKILKKRELSYLIEQYHQIFIKENDIQISIQNADMESVAIKRQDLILLARDKMLSSLINIKENRKKQFLNSACSEFELHSAILQDYLEGFYDIIFMMETKETSDEAKALFNSLSDQMCTELKKQNERVGILENKVRNFEYTHQVDFTSFYESTIREFTKKKDPPSEEILGKESDKETYINAFIEVGGKEQPVLDYLSEWFNKTAYGTLLIYGEPGHGKSLLCKKAVADFNDDESIFLKDKASNVLSVSLNTGDNPYIISDKVVSFEKILAWGPFKEHKFSYEDCSGALLFMDGFDEFIDEGRKANVPDIVSFMKTAGRIAESYKIHIVVLSRTIAVKSYLDKEANKWLRDISFPLLPLSENQQNEWINVHVDSPEYKVKYKRLQRDRNMKDLLGIPLLFRMIVHSRFDRVSSSSVDLYDDLFNHLMDKRSIQGDVLQSVWDGLKNLAYRIYCTDTDTALLEKTEWNENWIVSFYIKSLGDFKVGFFHRSFYQYFLAKYIITDLENLTAENAETYIGRFAERELDSTVRHYLSEMILDNNKGKLYAGMEKAINALVRTEAIIDFSPQSIKGDSEKSKIGRAANVYRNVLHIAAAIKYVISIPFKNNMDVLFKTYGCARITIHSSSKRADLHDVSLFFTDLSQSDLRKANLSHTNLERSDLSWCDLRGANLKRAHLEKVFLNSARLNRAELNSAVLSESNLRGALLIGANLSRARLNDADLYGAKLIAANLNEVSLAGANLSKADLNGANLNGADLYCANLREANLNGADLNGARLIDADLSDAQLGIANMAGAKIDRKFKELFNPGVPGYDSVQWVEEGLYKRIKIITVKNI